MILVAGSTGHLGGEACRLLLAQGHSVRALVRSTSDPLTVAALRAAGAEVVQGDLRDSASLAVACAGVDAVVATATATARPNGVDTIGNVDGAGQLALIDAARAAGAGHYVFVSFSGNIDRPCPLQAAKRAAEARLRESGMTYTIVRPSAFMEVWLSPLLGFDVPDGTVTIYGSGGAPNTYVSLFDVARFCVDALRNEAARNAILEIGGPEPITPLQAVRIAEDVVGRRLTVTHVPQEAIEAQYAGATDPLQKSFAALMLALAEGDVIDMRATLRTFPGPLRSVRQFMTQLYGRQVAAQQA